MKKKRAKHTTPAVEPTSGLDPFATVPDGEQLLEEARIAAGLQAAVDTEAPTLPIEPPADMPIESSSASDVDPVPHEDGRSTGKANRPTSAVEAVSQDMSRGIETFGRHAQNAYMPPDPAAAQPGQWQAQDQDQGYAPSPQVWTDAGQKGWSEQSSRPWAEPAPPPAAWQGYPHQPPTLFAPPDAMRPQTSQLPRNTAQLGLKPNFAAMMCYLPYLGIVGSILALQNEPKENRFVRFHARQSLIAHITFWAITIAFAIAQAAAPRVASILIGIGGSLFHLGSVVGLVWMMVRTYQGRAEKIPVIGEQVDV